MFTGWLLAGLEQEECLLSGSEQGGVALCHRAGLYDSDPAFKETSIADAGKF